MSIPIKTEQSLLSHAEFEMMRGTRPPAIYQNDVAALKSFKTRLRDVLGEGAHACAAKAARGAWQG